MDALLLTDERCLAHDPGPGHPEGRSRVEPVLRSLEAAPVAVDVNGDGVLEVIVGGHDRHLYCLRHAGARASGRAP